SRTLVISWRIVDFAAALPALDGFFINLLCPFCNSSRRKLANHKLAPVRRLARGFTEQGYQFIREVSYILAFKLPNSALFAGQGKEATGRREKHALPAKESLQSRNREDLASGRDDQDTRIDERTELGCMIQVARKCGSLPKLGTLELTPELPFLTVIGTSNNEMHVFRSRALVQ